MPDQSRTLTIDQARIRIFEATNILVPKHTIYRWLHTAKLAAVHHPKRGWRIPDAVIDALIKRHLAQETTWLEPRTESNITLAQPASRQAQESREPTPTC